MTDRLKSLQRIDAVRKQMVRLSELRLAAADRKCHELAETKQRLETYVVCEGALGVTLAKAALKSLHVLDGRQMAAERGRAQGHADLEAAKRSEHLAGKLIGTETRKARRAEEDRELADTVEIWLSDQCTSLR